MEEALKRRYASTEFIKVFIDATRHVEAVARSSGPVRRRSPFRGIGEPEPFCQAHTATPTQHASRGTGGGDALDQLASLAPAGRPARPEEVASAIAYLISYPASFVHGTVLPAIVDQQEERLSPA